MDALRSDLARYLGFESGDPRAPKSPDVSINRLNGHIIVKVCFRASGCDMFRSGMTRRDDANSSRAGENLRSSSSYPNATSN